MAPEARNPNAVPRWADTIPMRLYMAVQVPAPDTPVSSDSRRRRLLFRATHRGTREADLLLGGFVLRGLCDFDETELLQLEAILELSDVDLAEWLSGRRPIPVDQASPMLVRLMEACSREGAGMPVLDR